MELSDSILAEERHIFADSEGEMVPVNLLLEDNLVAKLFAKPGHISWSGKTVQISREQSCRHVIVFDRHKWNISLAVDFFVFDRSVVVSCEFAIVDHLGVVDESAVALATGLI